MLVSFRYGFGFGLEYGSNIKEIRPTILPLTKIEVWIRLMVLPLKQIQHALIHWGLLLDHKVLGLGFCGFFFNCYFAAPFVARLFITLSKWPPMVMATWNFFEPSSSIPHRGETSPFYILFFDFSFFYLIVL